MNSTQEMINPSCHKPLASQKILFVFFFVLCKLTLFNFDLDFYTFSNLLVEKYDVKIHPKSSNKVKKKKKPYQEV